MNDIKVFKMISGEEVIAQLVEKTADGFLVDEPASIMMHDQGGGRVGVGIAPFMPYAKERKVTINQTAVAAWATPADEMIQEYNRIFGAGIQIAPASALAGLR